TISPTTINEVRVGWNRRKYARFPESLNQGWAEKLGIPNVGPETMPIFLNNTGVNPDPGAAGQQIMFRYPGGTELDVNESVSLQENLTMVRGTHTFKTGYEILRTRHNVNLSATPSGIYQVGGTEFPFRPNTGNPFASFMLVSRPI
ncbi:MAG: hypothetical protein ACREI2_16200, partial [Nitrospiraceae bacterium]